MSSILINKPQSDGIAFQMPVFLTDTYYTMWEMPLVH